MYINFYGVIDFYFTVFTADLRVLMFLFCCRHLPIYTVTQQLQHKHRWYWLYTLVLYWVWPVQNFSPICETWWLVDS